MGEAGIKRPFLEILGIGKFGFDNNSVSYLCYLQALTFYKKGY
jgi:hypothetical protein